MSADKVIVENIVYAARRNVGAARRDGPAAQRGGAEPRRILDDVSFAAPEGQVFTILGPSGAGKSTLLRTINRLIDPTSGRVLLDGRPIEELPVQELRRRLGMVFQAAALFEGTVLDNVCYGPRLRHESPAEPEGETELVRGLLGQVGLPADFVGKPVTELSGGEAQRVSLARALANRPEVLLLDEPTAALDPTASRRVEELLVQLAAESELTYIFVTHNLEQARRIGDQGLLLVDGRVVEQGPLRELLSSSRNEITQRFVSGQLGMID